MPRLAGLDAPGILQHVIGRGNERKKIFFNDTARQVCKKHNISLRELCSGSRRRFVVEARGSISWIAVRELVYSGADVARILGVTDFCMTRLVASGIKPVIDDLNKKL